jgi:hypothetical protein
MFRVVGMQRLSSFIRLKECAGPGRAGRRPCLAATFVMLACDMCVLQLVLCGMQKSENRLASENQGISALGLKEEKRARTSPPAGGGQAVAASPAAAGPRKTGSAAQGP